MRLLRHRESPTQIHTEREREREWGRTSMGAGVMTVMAEEGNYTFFCSERKQNSLTQREGEGERN